MTEEAQARTQQDLFNYLSELRGIRHPEPTRIGSCIGGPAYDHRLNNGLPCGPFNSVLGFNDTLVLPFGDVLVLNLLHFITINFWTITRWSSATRT